MSILSKTPKKISPVHTTPVANRSFVHQVATINGVKGIILYRDHKPNTPATEDVIHFAAGAHERKPSVKYSIKPIKVSTIKATPKTATKTAPKNATKSVNRMMASGGLEAGGGQECEY